MSSSSINLTLVCIVLAIVQALAALPWLFALNPLSHPTFRSFSFLGKGLAGSVVVGVGIAMILDSNADPRSLTGWGRIYMSLLHLQLGTDCFALIFFVLLNYWSKGGAVALASFQEGLRQPMFWLLGAAAFFVMIVSPFIPFFTFGEDLKMVKELCYALTMLAPAVFAVIAAGMSISEEIEGRTAITLMSKPISRRQFLLGKFGGILLAALFLTMVLGWLLVWVILIKQWNENPLINPGSVYAEPAWVVALIREALPEGPLAELLKGVGFWANDAFEALPSMIIGFCQVMVLLSITVALATRLPLVVTIPLCVFVYLLGHLTSILKAVTAFENSSTPQNAGTRLVHFVSQVFDTILPGLDLFDVGSSITRDFPLPMGAYFVYTGNVALYALTYTAIALLFGLVLFEDRDLA